MKISMELNTIKGRVWSNNVTFMEIEAYGSDVEECLENATVGLEYPNGENDFIGIGDLPSRLYDLVESAVSEEFYHRLEMAVEAGRG